MAWAVPVRRNRLVLALFVFGHLLVISGQVDGGGGASLLQRSVFTLLTPFERAVSGSVRGVREAWRGYLDLRGVRQENLRLNERLQTLERLLQEKQEKVREGERLRELLKLRDSLRLDTIGAEVVAREGLPWFRSILVNQGSHAGVTLNSAVLTPLGVVGRVVAVGPKAARIQLLLDRDCAVGTLVGEQRVATLVQGQVGLSEAGTSDLIMKYVPALTELRAGDAVVASGDDGIYPKGFPVGRVRAVGQPTGLFREVLVQPAVDFGRLEEVLIVKTPASETRLTEAVR
jgi:rod shape-determining protein MreC